MLEKLFGALPDWVKSKLMMRIIYTVSSFLTARVISFLTGQYLDDVFGKFVAASGHIGIVVQLKVVSVDSKVLEAAITGLLMIMGEFVISHVHENKIKPAILASQAPEVPK
jgi:hypothetical protein